MLLLLLSAVALAQQPRQRATIVRDSTPADSAKADSTRPKPAYRRAVTDALRASAFKDAAARDLLARARAARHELDSTLHAYDAKGYERLSVGMGMGSIGRERLLFRQEHAGRVRWQKGVGVWTEITGARTAIPMAPPEDQKKENRDDLFNGDVAVPVPYYPGYESLWIPSSTVRSQVDDADIVHPLAIGAEAYYTYETGDSLDLRLPNKSVIRLRELKIRPRQPAWNLCVGSFWFDVSTGQLVRAAYRLAIPITFADMTTGDTTGDHVPWFARAMIGTIDAQITAVAIEYGLYEGRYWLPRLRSMSGKANVSFLHVPFSIDESFDYNSVNGPDTLKRIVIAGHVADEGDDSASIAHIQLWRDSVNAAYRDSVKLAKGKPRRGPADTTRVITISSGGRRDTSNLPPCDSTTGFRTTTRYRYGSRVPIAVQVPCDDSKLETSADLPKSIYGSDEEVFSASDRDALVQQALSMGAQPPIQWRLAMLPPPTIIYGPEMMRYNRVEGFSLGASADEQIGGGYDVLALGRFGFADREPNAELTVTRSNLTESVHLSGYNHLVSASDWGHPLSFGSSLSSLLFGRDEGFYYRASGVSLSGDRTATLGGSTAEWRLFAEQERTAAVNTSFAVDGANFPPNLVARRGWYEGASGRMTNVYGLDPRGFELQTDFRIEAAYGDSLYARSALDLTASHGLGPLAGALTLSGGMSAGAVPAQRLWYLGGSQTVRGQSPDTAQSGNAFWMTRAELGTNDGGMRPTIFGDLGWVGDRTKLRDVGRPLSGVGAGLSFLDGMFRFDVARGLYPRKQYRVDFYLNAKF